MRISILILGFKGLRNDDEDGREHIAKFTLFIAAINSDSLSWSNVGDISWISIFKDWSQVRKENEDSSKLLRRIRRFQVAVVQWTSKVY